jgi:hypothetical protein
VELVWNAVAVVTAEYDDGHAAGPSGAVRTFDHDGFTGANSFLKFVWGLRADSQMERPSFGYFNSRRYDMSTSAHKSMSTRQRNRLPAERFAFTTKRKEPITDARHVRNAIARFDQVEDVSDAERDAAWKRIRAAARRFGVEVHVKGWRSLMKGGRTGNGR